MIRARRTLIFAAVSVAVIVFAGAVFAASRSNQPPKSSNQQGVTNRAETPGTRSYPTSTSTPTPGPVGTPCRRATSLRTTCSPTTSIVGLGAELASTDPTACFNAGIHLPQGAKITWVDFYYRSGAAGDFYGEIVRQEVATGTGESLGVVNPLDDSDVPTSSSINIVPGLQKVKNAIYAYMVGRLSQRQRLLPRGQGRVHLQERRRLSATSDITNKRGALRGPSSSRVSSRLFPMLSLVTGRQTSTCRNSQ